MPDLSISSGGGYSAPVNLPPPGGADASTTAARQKANFSVSNDDLSRAAVDYESDSGDNKESLEDQKDSFTGSHPAVEHEKEGGSSRLSGDGRSTSRGTERTGSGRENAGGAEGDFSDRGSGGGRGSDGGGDERASSGSTRSGSYLSENEGEVTFSGEVKTEAGAYASANRGGAVASGQAKAKAGSYIAGTVESAVSSGQLKSQAGSQIKSQVNLVVEPMKAIAQTIGTVKSDVSTLLYWGDDRRTVALETPMINVYKYAELDGAESIQDALEDIDISVLAEDGMTNDELGDFQSEIAAINASVAQSASASKESHKSKTLKTIMYVSDGAMIAVGAVLCCTVAGASVGAMLIAGGVIGLAMAASGGKLMNAMVQGWTWMFQKMGLPNAQLGAQIFTALLVLIIVTLCTCGEETAEVGLEEGLELGSEDAETSAETAANNASTDAGAETTAETSMKTITECLQKGLSKVTTDNFLFAMSNIAVAVNFGTNIAGQIVQFKEKMDIANAEIDSSHAMQDAAAAELEQANIDSFNDSIQQMMKLMESEFSAAANTGGGDNVGFFLNSHANTSA